MAHKKIGWAGLAIVCLTLGQGAHAEPNPKTITIAADVWCPINCAADGNNLGVGIDIAKRVFEPLGYTVNYVIMPWARALEDVRVGKVDAVVGANAADDPTLVFPKNALYDITDDFYVLKDSTLSFNGMSSLKGLRLGVIKDYGYNEVIMRFIGENKTISGMVQEVGGNDALEQNIKKLLAGRIEVIVESRPVMDYTLRHLKLTDAIKHIGSIRQGKIYLAFSPALTASKARVRQYDEGVAKLRTTGALPEIYKRYGLFSKGF